MRRNIKTKIKTYRFKSNTIPRVSWGSSSGENPVYALRGLYLNGEKLLISQINNYELIVYMNNTKATTIWNYYEEER